MRFTYAHDAKGITAIMPEDKERLGKLLDNLDIAIERSMSGRSRDIGEKIRSQIEAIAKQSVGTPLNQAELKEIDEELNKLVDRYGADGFIYRTDSSALVAEGRRMMLFILAGEILMTVLMAILLQRTIIPPITHAVNVAMAIEGGKLDNEIKLDGSSEAVALLTALSQMQSSIATNILRIEEKKDGKKRKGKKR